MFITSRDPPIVNFSPLKRIYMNSRRGYNNIKNGSIAIMSGYTPQLTCTASLMTYIVHVYLLTKVGQSTLGRDRILPTLVSSGKLYNVCTVHVHVPTSTRHHSPFPTTAEGSEAMEMVLWVQCTCTVHA